MQYQIHRYFCWKMWKATHIFFSKNISMYVIFNDQKFNIKLTNDIVSFEQLSPDVFWKELSLRAISTHIWWCITLLWKFQKFCTSGIVEKLHPHPIDFCITCSNFYYGKNGNFQIVFKHSTKWHIRYATWFNRIRLLVCHLIQQNKTFGV